MRVSCAVVGLCSRCCGVPQVPHEQKAQLQARGAQFTMSARAARISSSEAVARLTADRSFLFDGSMACFPSRWQAQSASQAASAACKPGLWQVRGACKISRCSCTGGCASQVLAGAGRGGFFPPLHFSLAGAVREPGRVSAIVINDYAQARVGKRGARAGAPGR